MIAPTRPDGAPPVRFWSGWRIFALVAVISGLALFIGANVHLISVAFASKPDCVLQPQTEGAASYRPAKSSC